MKFNERFSRQWGTLVAIMGSLVSMPSRHIFICLIVAACCISAGASDLKASEVQPAGRALVKADSVVIYSQMSVESKVVKTLKNGDVVTVEVEVEGRDGAWCGIAEHGQSMISGYVQCRHLEREGLQKKVWKDVGSSGSKPDNNATRVTLAGNTVLVPVTLGDRGNTVEALLVLDTGSSVTLISTEIAARLDIHSTVTRKVQVVGGALVEVALARLSYISVEPYTKKDVLIGIIEDNGPLKYDGLLGMDFLRDLKYHIDFEHRVIRWNE